MSTRSSFGRSSRKSIATWLMPCCNAVIINAAGRSWNGDGNASPIPGAGSIALSGTATSSATRQSCSTSSKVMATPCNSSDMPRW